MTLKTIARWFCLIGALQLSCDKDPVEPEPAPLEFYAFGHYRDKPAYWKTDKATLMEGYPTIDELLDGEVSGSDVYGLGMAEEFDRIYPVCWKNGDVVELSVGNEYARATAIVVNGSDVYAVGYAGIEEEEGNSYTVPKYWKNGVGVELPTSKNGFSRAVSIAISGPDVHVIGWEDIRFKGLDSLYAVYWKNGQRMAITPTSRYDNMVEIALHGPDVLIAGITHDESGGFARATLWKNGVPQPLTVGTVESYATQIVIVGDDVYVGGGNDKRAAYWKNGEITTLETGARFASSMSDMIWQDDKLIISGWNYEVAYAYQGSFVWSEGKMHEPFTGNDGLIFVTGISPKP